MAGEGEPRAEGDGAELCRLRGVGPRLAARLAEAGVHDLAGLALNVPRRLRELAEVEGPDEDLVGQEVSTVARVLSVGVRRFGRRRNLAALRLEPVAAPGSVVEATFFGQAFLGRSVDVDRVVRVSGRLARPSPRRWSLEAPRLELDWEPRPPGAMLEPVYAAVAGLSPLRLRRLIDQVLELVADGRLPALRERLPAAFLDEQRMLPLPAAVLAMHRPPPDPEARERARRRVALREAAALMGEVRARRARRAARAAARIVVDATLAGRIAARLPFTPSPDQERAIADIHVDLAGGRPMARLLQGDVGTGKTLVALAAALAVTARGHKAVLMAPTEVLAEQHAVRFGRDLVGARLPVRLHTASVPARVRRETEALLAAPGPALVVGTHALLGGELGIHDLGLLVIDEQQRFGVAQRARLWRPEAGRWPHVLVMSATPIPRTLATALFGDLDCSELRLPPTARRPVDTEVLAPTAWPGLVRRIEAEVAGGGRVFVVCPRIGAGDDGDDDGEEATAGDGDEGAVATWRELSASLPAALVHGRLKPAERRAAQRAFRDGELGCLVGTTLLEVGIDVPEATWMVVRDADRLGLATLHQLRGRVGRGDRPARCVLVGDPANERLQHLAANHDGFAIAELDLVYRGAGELGGARQHGRWRFRCLDPFRDHDLLGLAGGGAPTGAGPGPSPAREAAL